MSTKEKSTQDLAKAKSPLHQAVDATPDVVGNYKDGLAALGKNSVKVTATNPRLINGSLDIDTCTHDKYPNDSRWDYAVEYANQTYFIEVHPASTSEVSEMKKKLTWLKQWLKTKAPEIEKVRATGHPFFWIYTNRSDILKTSPQYRTAAALGLLPRASLNLTKL